MWIAETAQKLVGAETTWKLAGWLFAGGAQSVQGTSLPRTIPTALESYFGAFDPVRW